MNSFEDNILKPEEEFGGFDADNDNIFLLNTDEASSNLLADNTTVNSMSVDATQQQKEVEKPPKVKSISPPIYIPENNEIRKKSSFPAFATVISVILILSLFVFDYYRKLNNFTILKNSYPPQYIYDNNLQTLTIDDELTIEPKEESNTTIQQNESFVTKETQRDNPAYTQEKSKIKEPNKNQSIIYSNDAQNKEQKNTQDMAETNRNESKTFNNDIKKSAAQDNNQTGLFTVEVYSSSSYEDAKQWLDKLERRNLRANIVPLKIRDEIVYKVRFGNFSTFKEASNSAMNLGFTHFYIDKIR